MNWNYTMGNDDVAHGLMLQAALPTSSGLRLQQSLAFTFFTLLLVNANLVWNLFSIVDAIMQFLSLIGRYWYGG